MTGEQVSMLARAVGAVEAEVKSLRLDWEKERREWCKHLTDIRNTLSSMEARHDRNDALATEQRTAEEMLAQQRAQRRSQVETVWTVLNHGLVRAIVAAGAAGAGFGLIAEVLR